MQLHNRTAAFIISHRGHGGHRGVFSVSSVPSVGHHPLMQTQGFDPSAGSGTEPTGC
jgi:hypothetical protein